VAMTSLCVHGCLWSDATLVLTSLGDETIDISLK
jgi:hypothetical protein